MKLFQELRVRFSAVVGDEKHLLAVRLEAVHDFRGPLNRVVQQPQYTIAVGEYGVERVVKVPPAFGGQRLNACGRHHLGNSRV